MTALLRFANITCRRGGRILFEGLHLELDPAQALRVVGPNGSGKSSLLRLAAGLLSPERGTVDGSPIALADDDLALDRELALGKALAFWGGNVEEGMAALGLGDLRDVPVRLLSAGQGKRASLARVVASAAPLWLLDEPANALDTGAVGQLAKAIEKHLASGGAVVAASHTALPGQWRTLELGS